MNTARKIGMLALATTLALGMNATIPAEGTAQERVVSAPAGSGTQKGKPAGFVREFFCKRWERYSSSYLNLVEGAVRNSTRESLADHPMAPHLNVDRVSKLVALRVQNRLSTYLDRIQKRECEAGLIFQNLERDPSKGNIIRRTICKRIDKLFAVASTRVEAFVAAEAEAVFLGLARRKFGESSGTGLLAVSTELAREVANDAGTSIAGTFDRIRTRECGGL